MLYFSLPNFISSSTQQPIVLTAFLPGPPIWEPMGSLRWSKSALLDHLWPQSYPTVSAASSLFPRAALPSNAYPAEGGDWSEKLESHTGEDTEPYPCVQRTVGSRKRHPTLLLNSPKFLCSRESSHPSLEASGGIHFGKKIWELLVKLPVEPVTQQVHSQVFSQEEGKQDLA